MKPMYALASDSPSSRALQPLTKAMSKLPVSKLPVERCSTATNRRSRIGSIGSLTMLVAILQVGCAMDTYGGRGAALGGLSGAAVGAAIGDHNDNALLGTAVGALAGATVGSAVGNQIDADVQQARYDATLATQQNMAATLNQVVGMSQQGVSNEVIVNQIRSQGVPRPISSNEVIQLKQQGVSDQVIAALQTSSPVQPVRYAAPSPVIVEEVHHWGPPVVYRPYRRGYYCAPPHRRGGVSWGVSFHGH